MPRQRSSKTGPEVALEAQYFAFTSFGVDIGLRGSDARLLRDASRYLPIGWKPTPSLSPQCVYSLIYQRRSSLAVNSIYRLIRDGRKLYSCTRRVDFLERFASTVALYVADNSRTLVFLHAGVVGFGGQAILIPGRSFAGKTTLVAELVRAGATYYSDEFAVIDEHGMVHPYAQPLQMRKPGSFRQTKTPVERFGGVAGHEPLPVGLIVFCKYRKGARWCPTWLSAGQGLLRALDNTVSARSAPAIALRTLKEVVLKAPAISGTRGDASQAVDWIMAHFPSPGIDLAKAQ